MNEKICNYINKNLPRLKRLNAVLSTVVVILIIMEFLKSKKKYISNAIKQENYL